uniref:SAC3/GANP/THP3 conserved domain-containing protein n=1 Tax=Skeletonema marinoi TaxID=267567 RepID=A0A7S2KR89_9STRA|mmetsp:Transcript_15901/g.26855  ORF Transcript_15901/g.26855 Transcript_15901/m.26855 type:complete len:618 (+) Transcript_15901:101-1954(+)
MANIGAATGSQVLNGLQWVSNPATPSTASTIYKHGKTHTQLVQHYTNYYHLWNAQAEKARLKCAADPNNAEAIQREKWATYYSTNSAALSHYHLGICQGGAVPVQRAQSPPAPPSAAQTPAVATQQAAAAAHQIQTGTVAVSSNVPASPQEAKKKSRWAKVESTEPSNQDSNGKLSRQDSNSVYNNFVPERGNQNTVTSVSSVGKKRKFEPYNSTLSANDSYYGPSSSGADNSSIKAEDEYIPFGLDMPLGGTKSAKKKKQKQKGFASLAENGFDQDHSTLSERAQRFRGEGGISSASKTKSTVANVEKYMGKGVIGGSNQQLTEEDYVAMTVKGTCQVLEKHYLRLTSPPKAELVRPQPILAKHLKNLKKSWKKGRIHKGTQRDYNWYCSQFKALRQDLTVQRIFNAFAVDVYETHAKIALEEDDINEYNQSQTQLKELYDSINGHENEEGNEGALKNMNEFVSYRIIYYVFLSGNKKYEGGSSDVLKIIHKLSPEQRSDPFIQHSLLVRAAVADNDYHKFFQLQDSAPNMSDYLMDKIVPSIRQSALQTICKAYRPSVSTSFVLRGLGFNPDDKQEYLSGKAWMESCGCKFEGDNLITKDTLLRESSSAVKNSLI